MIARGNKYGVSRTVSSYNQHMGGVDLLDQMVDHMAGERPFHKFWKKCFFSVVDRMAFCAYILYEKNTSVQPKRTRFQFMCALIEELCAASDDQATPDRALPAPCTHRPALLPGRKEKDCVVCSNRLVRGGRKRSRTHCQGCQVGVHIKCFDQLDHIAKKKRVNNLLQK